MNAAPAGSDPVASIIILSLANRQMLTDCLESVSRELHNCAFSCEVIVLFQQTNHLRNHNLGSVENLVKLYAPLNLGFGAGNNFAANRSCAKYLIFLNDDSIVQPGWLQALIQTAESDERIGAVGSRIAFPNGMLQEAGAIIWSDGSCYPVGRGEAPGSLAYSYMRDVDYTSANGLLVRRGAFNAAGGFDERYFPAYYEDVDLCMTIRHVLGQRVVYQPRSILTHLESATSRNDPEFRTFLFCRHQKMFGYKWAAFLNSYSYPDPQSAIAVERALLRARGNPQRVLVVDDRIPSTGMGSGAGRIGEMLKELTLSGFAVAFAPTDLRGALTTNPLSALGVDLITEPVSAHVTRPEKRYDAVIISRPHNFSAYYAAIHEAQPNAAVVYDIEALYHRRLFLQAHAEADAAQRSRLLAEADNMELTEINIAGSVDRLVAISDSEARWIETVDGHAAVDYMRPLSADIRPTPPKLQGRAGAVFVAGWLAGEDSPNVGALRWYASEVLPHIREALPGFRTFVTGGNPPLSVQLLEADGIELIGMVPELEDLYRSVRVAIAPILVGAGVKIKTIEALQFGVPVVATVVGAEGLGLLDTVDIDVSDDPLEFASSVIALCSNDALWRSRRENFTARIAEWSRDRVEWTGVVTRALEAVARRRASLQC